MTGIEVYVLAMPFVIGGVCFAYAWWIVNRL